tara:strand:- start:561 stop:1280 length:720 start_codon:yes stop_codon:yes gene_type:complete
MFGMNDPAQTLMQLESYIKDGRLEMAEVMATQFTDMFLHNKKRNQYQQNMLVRGLQILCDVLITRNKFALSMASAKTLLRERKKITEPDNTIGNYYQDLQRCGKAFALAGKKRKGKSFFIKAFKQSGGCVAATLDGVTVVDNDNKMNELFLRSLDQSGPVIRSGQSFIIQPENLPAVEVDAVLQALERPTLSSDSRAKQHVERLKKQIAAIESGEMAANAKLQNALDSLKPKHDYYEYS